MSFDRHELAGRPLFVREPTGTGSADGYPTVYVLHAHMRSALSWFNVAPFQQTYPDAIDELDPPAVVVLVDGWTALGGGQWIGEHAAYLCEHVVPFVESRYPTNGIRALQGKSSGGYGAIVNALRRPDFFHAFAAHAPDALFEVTIAHGFAPAARELREHHDGSLEAFWASFDGLDSRGDALLVELGALAAAFSSGELPFDPETAMLVPEVWERWLAHDPVRVAGEHAQAVRGLRGAWLDAGRADEYFLDLGVLALRRALLAAGLPEHRLHSELVDGGHGGMSHRYPLSLAFLVAALSEPAADAPSA